jgi:hypothetical protein
MPEEDEITRLLRALERRSDKAEDSELKTVLKEFTAELRKLNEGNVASWATEEQVADHEELARRYPALRSRPPVQRRPRQQAS